MHLELWDDSPLFTFLFEEDGSRQFRKRNNGNDKIVGAISARFMSADEAPHHAGEQIFTEAQKGSFEQVAYIKTLGTRAEYRRKGLARKLVELSIEFSQKCTGCGAIYLHVIQGNISAMSLYARCGFVRLRRLAGYYHIKGRSYDAYLYVRYFNGAVAPTPKQDMREPSFSESVIEPLAAVVPFVMQTIAAATSRVLQRLGVLTAIGAPAYMERLRVEDACSAELLVAMEGGRAGPCAQPSVGEDVEVGSGTGSGADTSRRVKDGAIAVESTAATPDLIAEVWRQYDVSTGEWLCDPDVRINNECSNSTGGSSFLPSEDTTVADEGSCGLEGGEQVTVLARVAEVRRLTLRGLNDDRQDVMGVYELVEGEVMNGKAVWQHQSWDEQGHFLYYSSAGEWCVGDPGGGMAEC
jgi:ribosomal protein S18 acetylase RimI-like enzyme